jgi:hypothetical protein
MGRVLRLAQSQSAKGNKGLEVLSYLQRPESVQALLQAAEHRLTPVTAVSQSLREQFGPATFTPPIMRQLVGLAVRAILEEHGFVLIKRGAQLPNDPIFRSGALYAKRSRGASKDVPLLKRLIDSLSIAELRWVADYAAKQLQYSIGGPDDASGGDADGNG